MAKTKIPLKHLCNDIKLCMIAQYICRTKETMSSVRVISYMIINSELFTYHFSLEYCFNFCYKVGPFSDGCHHSDI